MTIVSNYLFSSPRPIEKSCVLLPIGTQNGCVKWPFNDKSLHADCRATTIKRCQNIFYFIMSRICSYNYLVKI